MRSLVFITYNLIKKKMTPQEMRDIARQAAQQEYKAVIDELNASAKQGQYSCKFLQLSDATQEMLKEQGYIVNFDVFASRLNEPAITVKIG
jgi:arginine utilization protein RocB